MIKYQARFGGSEGLFMHCRVFTCDTDEHAIVWAKQLMDGGPLELWSGAKSDASHFSGR